MVTKLIGLSPDLIIHPGETLSEVLEEKNMTQKELAKRTGISEKHISKVINGKANISSSFAKKLEYALGLNFKFWNNLQSNYDEEIINFNEVNKIEKEEFDILKRLRDIVTYFKELKLLNNETNESIEILNLRMFLGVYQLSYINELIDTKFFVFRVSRKHAIDNYVLFAWLKLCEYKSSLIEVNRELDIEKLKRSISNIKMVMFEETEKIENKLQNIFKKCGIVFSIVKHFCGAPVNGFIKKMSNGQMNLSLTIRGSFADIFWFSLFHEIAHILNDDISNEFIDYSNTNNDIELRADNMAKNILIDSKLYNKFVEKSDFSLNSIRNFAENVKAQNYIVIGRLQKDGYLKYNDFSSEKVRYKWVSD